MKRDMNLLRKILLAVEANNKIHVSGLSIDGYTEEQTGFHVRLLAEAGLLDIVVTNLMSQLPSSLLTKSMNITHQGSEFLGLARESSRWELATNKVKASGNSVPFSVLKQLLATLNTENLDSHLLDITR